MSETTQGRRVEWADGFTARGDYAKLEDGTWYGLTPNGHLANLAKHDITEHEDGTITVSPSILVTAGSGEQWHGYLERGQWRQV